VLVVDALLVAMHDMTNMCQYDDETATECVTYSLQDWQKILGRDIVKDVTDRGTHGDSLRKLNAQRGNNTHEAGPQACDGGRDLVWVAGLEGQCQLASEELLLGHLFDIGDSVAIDIELVIFARRLHHHQVVGVDQSQVLDGLLPAKDAVSLDCGKGQKVVTTKECHEQTEQCRNQFLRMVRLLCHSPRSYDQHIAQCSAMMQHSISGLDRIGSIRELVERERECVYVQYLEACPDDFGLFDTDLDVWRCCIGKLTCVPTNQ
jgi:hypothetical protein